MSKPKDNTEELLDSSDLLSLLKSIKEYIQCVEEQIDGEWGICRGWKQLLEDNEMPDEYHEVCSFIKLLTDSR